MANFSETNTATFQRATGIASDAVRWFNKVQTRRALRGLTLQQLSDIGVSEKAADTEAAKGFWQ